MNQPFLIPKKLSRHQLNGGFTIVEMIVTIVIIGILAVIVVVGYISVTQKAKSAAIQSDLADALTTLKVFQAHNDKYPITVSTNCTTGPDSDTNKCLKFTNGDTVIGYSANNSSNPQTFLLIASNGTLNYKITNGTPPTQLAQTMQPGVTPGASLELHGAKANAGSSQGINAPLTSTWADTSGNSNNSAIVGITGTPWAGVGTLANPYNLTFDGASNKLVYPSLTVTPSKNFTYESWFKTTNASATNRVLIGEDASGGAPLITLMLASGHQATIYWWGPGWSADAAIFGMNGGALNNGVWHHAVATADGTRLRLYVDNVEQSDGNNTYNLVSASSTGVNQTTVGAYGSGAYFPGSIAVTRIYQFGLSAAQVTANYNAGADW